MCPAIVQFVLKVIENSPYNRDNPSTRNYKHLHVLWYLFPIIAAADMSININDWGGGGGGGIDGKRFFGSGKVELLKR